MIVSRGERQRHSLPFAWCAGRNLLQCPPCKGCPWPNCKCHLRLCHWCEMSEVSAKLAAKLTAHSRASARIQTTSLWHLFNSAHHVGSTMNHQVLSSMCSQPCACLAINGKSYLFFLLLTSLSPLLPLESQLEMAWGHPGLESALLYAGEMLEEERYFPLQQKLAEWRANFKHWTFRWSLIKNRREENKSMSNLKLHAKDTHHSSVVVVTCRSFKCFNIYPYHRKKCLGFYAWLY